MTCPHDRSDAGNCRCQPFRDIETTIDFMVQVKVKGEGLCDQSMKDLLQKPLEDLITCITCMDITPDSDKVTHVNMESATITHYEGNKV